ncbi:hypothetical protein [Streptomyces griseocarneus]|uniref:hypothetical protein n=1 Tax=Streptomyces griseocarneus TaxID=51201 RepID=UPI00167CC365|nr:hypothetical protein [Streptomyces griseocarneus]MBZ6474442.1 hypothetical protein [Streptomyces griseocarneus]GHG68252.1 hypothetical protein GCM10018779_40860 [Streptomyces griseocarneus]
MFRRTFWFTTGVAAGVWATTKVNRKLAKLTPESLALQAADRAVIAGRKVKLFALDVRDGMAHREEALKDALGLSAAPPGPEPRALPEQRRLVALEQHHTHHPFTRKEDH